MKIKSVKDRCPLYTEEYIVKYRVIENGLEVVKEKSYWATTKGAHEKISKVFAHSFPKAEIISIKYQ